MDAIQELIDTTTQTEQDAREYGVAFAQFNTGHREGVAVEYHKDWGWSGCVFNAIEDRHTKHYETMAEAIEAIRELLHA